MNMEYRLLDNKRGFILTREPENVNKNLYITFTGAPEYATAIFENIDGDSLYRELKDGMCDVPVPFLKGIVKVSVVVLNSSINAPKWNCEEIKIIKQKNEVFVCPNDMNIPLQMVEILLEQQTIKEDIKKLSDNYSELNLKLEKLLEGYDIT